MKKMINLIITAITIFIVCLTTYLFGWEVLEGYLKGNDVGFYIVLVDWFKQYLWSMPQWYPYAGGGISIVQATQVGSYYLVAIVSLLFNLTSIQAYRLVEFLSIVIISLQLYFFIWYFFKKPVMGLVTAIFFPLTQAVWSIVITIGMAHQIVSLVFVMPFFSCFEIFCRQKKPIFLILTSVFFGLAAFTHLITGALLIEGVVIYALTRAVLMPSQKISRQIVINLFWTMMVIIIGFTIFSFWFLPYLRYLMIISRNTVINYAFEQIDYINLRHLFGFGQELGGWENFLPLPITILGLAGIIISLVRSFMANQESDRSLNRLALIWGIMTIFFLVYSALPGLLPDLVKLFMVSIITGTYYRGFLMPMIFFPLMASWACLSIVQLCLHPLKQNLAGKILEPILTVMVAAVAIVFLAKAPSYYHNPCYRGIGFGQSTEFDFCHFWQKASQPGGISRQGTPWDEVVNNLAQRLNLSDHVRLDIAPNLGAIIMNWPRYSSSSMVGLYASWAGISNIFTGYFGGALYGKNIDFGTPDEVANLASWFGVDKVILESSSAYTARFTTDYWQEETDLASHQLVNTEVLLNKNPVGLVTLSSRPKILVIGRFANRAYEQFFRLAAAGAFPYGQAMLVEGKDSGRIDDYTQEELKNFDMILLYGYTYKNQTQAFDLLDKYVKNGGRLFIETGWQFVSPDWQIKKTPVFFPVNRLSWQPFSSWDLQDFADPLYKGNPWGVSVGEGLKDWAKTDLVANGKTIIASGFYGQGKVTWSGMNLIGHAFMYKNKAEYDYLKQLMDSLLIGKDGEENNNQLKWQRISPDKIEFTFKSTLTNVSLYWRENWYPDWRATLQGTTNRETRTKLPIYRAGPNFMLIPLEKVSAGDKLTLSLGQSKIKIFSKILSILIIISLLMIIFNVRVVNAFKEKLFGGFHYHLGGWWDKEE